MKKILSAWTIVFIGATGLAQSPEKMSYQAVIRNSNDRLITSQAVGMRISILKDSVSGTAVYTETQNPSTNANGLVTLEIGAGTTGDDFSAIDWSDGPYFVKTETDPAGGTGYTITGTSQLLSVPYALYAKKAESLVDQINLFRVSFKGDTLFSGPGNWVIIPGISKANTGFIDARDGNIYSTVTIGDQVWMAENLKYLPSVVGPAIGSGATPCYYVYDYNDTVVADAKATSNYITYGVLYNWPAAMGGSASSDSDPSGVQGVCPYGWHLPSKAEWTELTDYLGGDAAAWIKLKEAPSTHWYSNNHATNETGFTALPGGRRNHDWLIFDCLRSKGIWWSATGWDTGSWSLEMSSYSGDLFMNGCNNSYGLSVRCIRD